MKNKKKLSLKKMSIAQLDMIKGGDIVNPFLTGGATPSEQPIGGGNGGLCYSDAQGSCGYCV